MTAEAAMETLLPLDLPEAQLLLLELKVQFMSLQLRGQLTQVPLLKILKATLKTRMENLLGPVLGNQAPPSGSKAFLMSFVMLSFGT
jgi:hypothetical protein